jgi:colanic acid biosynthesis protein WcaH
VEFDPQPIAVEQLMEPDRRERGHFISLVFRCRLLGPPDPRLRYEHGEPPQRDQWSWHEGCPSDLIAAQVHYRRFF